MSILSYLFWPNPGLSSYDNPKILLLLALCFGLVIASFVLRAWRNKTSPVIRKIAKGWPTALLTFGLFGLLFTVSRVEGVQYVSMRIWWIVWAASAVFYAYLQVKKYRARYYEILPATSVEDPRSKYLPRKKR